MILVRLSWCRTLVSCYVFPSPALVACAVGFHTFDEAFERDGSGRKGDTGTCQYPFPAIKCPGD